MQRLTCSHPLGHLVQILRKIQVAARSRPHGSALRCVTRCCGQAFQVHQSRIGNSCVDEVERLELRQTLQMHQPVVGDRRVHNGKHVLAISLHNANGSLDDLRIGEISLHGNAGTLNSRERAVGTASVKSFLPSVPPAGCRPNRSRRRLFSVKTSLSGRGGSQRLSSRRKRMRAFFQMTIEPAQRPRRISLRIALRTRNDRRHPDRAEDGSKLR